MEIHFVLKLDSGNFMTFRYFGVGRMTTEKMIAFLVKILQKLMIPTQKFRVFGYFQLKRKKLNFFFSPKVKVRSQRKNFMN